MGGGVNFTLPFGLSINYFAGLVCDSHWHCATYWGGGGAGGCGANLALVILPEVAALRNATTLLKAGRGLNAAEIRQGVDGIAGMLKDFEELPGKETVLGEIKTKTLLDGTKVTARPFSKAGPPTLQLKVPSGEKIEIRY